MADKLVESVLEVRAVAGLDPKNDLTLRDGKSIAELLDEQKKEEQKVAEQCERDRVSDST